MPSKTKKQSRFMTANCKSPDFRKKTGMKKSVACDFHKADKGKYHESDEISRIRALAGLEEVGPHDWDPADQEELISTDDNENEPEVDSLEPEGPYAIVWHGQTYENYGAHDWSGDGEAPEHWKPKGDPGKVLAKNIPDYATAQKLLKKLSKVDRNRNDDYFQVWARDPEIVPMKELGDHFYGYDPFHQEYGARPEEYDDKNVIDMAKDGVKEDGIASAQMQRVNNPQEGAQVYHPVYGAGTVLKTDGDNTTVDFGNNEIFVVATRELSINEGEVVKGPWGSIPDEAEIMDMYYELQDPKYMGDDHAYIVNQIVQRLYDDWKIPEQEARNMIDNALHAAWDEQEVRKMELNSEVNEELPGYDAWKTQSPYDNEPGAREVDQALEWMEDSFKQFLETDMTKAYISDILNPNNDPDDRRGAIKDLIDDAIGTIHNDLESWSDGRVALNDDEIEEFVRNNIEKVLKAKRQENEMHEDKLEERKLEHSLEDDGDEDTEQTRSSDIHRMMKLAGLKKRLDADKEEGNVDFDGVFQGVAKGEIDVHESDRFGFIKEYHNYSVNEGPSVDDTAQELVDDFDGDVQKAFEYALSMASVGRDRSWLPVIDKLEQMGGDVDAIDFHGGVNDMSDDAEALASAGMGSDEDYGYYGEEDVNEVAPKGWEGTVKAMKKHKDIDNPYALAHWMKKKGYKSHEKESVELEGEYNKDAVDKEIKKDPRIKGREAKAIHALLKGRSNKTKNDKDLKEAWDKKYVDDVLNELRKQAKSHERTGQEAPTRQFANLVVNNVYGVIQWLESRVNDENRDKIKQAVDILAALRAEGKQYERVDQNPPTHQFANLVANNLYQVMQIIDGLNFEQTQQEEIMTNHDNKLFTQESLDRVMVEMIVDEMKSGLGAEEIAEKLSFDPDHVEYIVEFVKERYMPNAETLSESEEADSDEVDESKDEEVIKESAEIDRIKHLSGLKG